MKLLGLTGNIGAGKSTVAQIFKDLGLPVYNSDYWAKYLIQTDPHIRKMLVEWFGAEVYQADKLNKIYLSRQIFQSGSNLRRVNQLVHPRVAEHYKVWLTQQQSKWCLKESALIFENNLQANFDKIVTVHAPLQLRIERALRDDSQRKIKDIKAIVAQQSSDEFKMAKADWVVYNDGRPIREQVLKIHEALAK